MGEVCPPKEDIYPCVCQGSSSDIRITCKSGGLDEIEDALFNLKHIRIKVMNLEGLTIPRLPSLLFWGHQIESLVIKNCKLKGVSDEDGEPAFLGLEHTLKSLDIVKSIKKPEKLAGLNLAHLKMLEFLILMDNNIPEVDNEWFKNGPVSLVGISMFSCGIRTVGDRAFQSLLNIRQLEIYGNPFKTLRRTMLPSPANNLEMLTMSNGDLRSLPDDMFSNMPKIKRISLDSNKIQRLSSATWSPVWNQLQSVHIMLNPLICDEHIEWMFSLKKPYQLDGICVSPANRRGVHLSTLIENNTKSMVLKDKGEETDGET